MYFLDVRVIIVQGPLPTFSAMNNWEAPRCVKVKKGANGFGFSVRTSKPVRISGVDKGSGAEVLNFLYIKSFHTKRFT